MDYCNYDPSKDFNCCLREHERAEPSVWTREEAEQIRITPDRTAPLITDPFPIISQDLWTWDMWVLREKDGSIAVLPGGWRVLFTLAAPCSVLPNKRNDVAVICYFYSKNGRDWIEGGPVFTTEDAFGSRQWAGSAFVEDGQIYFFYTAAGRRGESQVTYEQRVAFTKGDVVADSNCVRFDNWECHKIILEADGMLYQTFEQSQNTGMAYAFRDPWFFKDPATGCEYLIFQGNTAGDINCGASAPPEASQFTGNIGMALLCSNDYTRWELLPPLLEATCTNQQLERPHIVVCDGWYYLFASTHKHSYAPGLDGPDGLYGYTANSLRGCYVPLNCGGLVIANPPEEPFQAYLWLVLPDFSVLSYINYFELDCIPLSAISNLPSEFQSSHFGGTPAPTLQIEITGNTTQIVDELDYGLVKVSETESPECHGCCCGQNHNGLGSNHQGGCNRCGGSESGRQNCSCSQNHNNSGSNHQGSCNRCGGSRSGNQSCSCSQNHNNSGSNHQGSCNRCGGSRSGNQSCSCSRNNNNYGVNYQNNCKQYGRNSSKY
ncbi:glycoside hydrolase family 68 protein [Halobacillus naozhouensis]|uniref:Glycoside hydrolase family 68 protein n=2 Tax=Halobacillus naozhouensis TaxID=554880 RepID=A0ABY8IYN7_9BACI|nr:glycoside hydrolase family 68 protein [Halobacillus naozhouensis]WFT74487.1 glycoside hydrolase family 68 protein [Halobacillus naozhouensis]